MANVCVGFAIFVINGFDNALPSPRPIRSYTETTNTSLPLSLMCMFLYVLYEVFYGLGFYDSVCAFRTVPTHVMKRARQFWIFPLSPSPHLVSHASNPCC